MERIEGRIADAQVLFAERLQSVLSNSGKTTVDQYIRYLSF